MAGKSRKVGKLAEETKAIFQYEHKDKKRVNNPPVGLVDAKSDAVEGKKAYAYDPHLDPTLVWAGKEERTSFEVSTVSLHVHERIDPRSILEAVRKMNGSNFEQLSLFSSKGENPPLREAIDFYKHAHNWSNRLIAGDSLLVMNSLLEKEGMAGKVQMVYFDPPYGITYGSNFQPFVNKRDVKDRKDEDLTAEPEMLKAFRDTWELNIHSYLSYLRDRVLLARDLLADAGSLIVQISDENIHHVREIMDEVFGASNFVALTYFRKKTMPLGGAFLERMGDYLVWYSKDRKLAQGKYRQLYREINVEGDFHWKWYEMPDGSRHMMTDEQLNNHKLLPEGSRIFRLVSMWPPSFAANCVFAVPFRGEKWLPPPGACYPTNPEGMARLAKEKRLEPEGQYLRYVMYLDEALPKLTSVWVDTVGARDQRYVVETTDEVVKRCVLMTTDPGDLVLDITCGSGTTALVSEQWGRRWITCDTSRVALTLAKQRLITALFDYYQLAQPEEGVGSGLMYKKFSRTSLKTIINNEPATEITLYDQPLCESLKTRVTGPFTVEAVPAPMVMSPCEFTGCTSSEKMPADESVARSGATVRQDEWRSELLRAGIRGKGGQMIRFSRVEPMPGTRWLHADAETKPNDDGSPRVREGAAEERQRVVVSFGPEHAPLEQRQVEQALEEARRLVPKPQIVVFTAFQFDPEAAKDIDEINWPGIMVLKAQMNSDLLTEDLKKKRASNESFWLIGQPDVSVRKIKRGEHQGEWEVEIHGFDYYNTKTGQIESGGADKVAVWMLDTDYDGRSLFPRQVFFPMAGEKEGWSKLSRNLKAELDEELIEAYRGTLSLPFQLGKHSRVAVKIVDDRGIESLKIISIE